MCTPWGSTFTRPASIRLRTLSRPWLIATALLVGAASPSAAIAAADAPFDLTRPMEEMLATGPERPLDAAVASDGALSTVWVQRDATDTQRVRSLHIDAGGTRHTIRTLSSSTPFGGSPYPAIAVRANGTAAVAWSSPTSVALLDGEGSPTVIRRLAEGGAAMVSIATAPGGRTIVTGDAVGATSLWILDADGSTRRRVTLDGGGASETEVHVAADGTITALWATGGRVELAVLTAEGDLVRQHTVLETSGMNYYRQLALGVGDDGTAVVAALQCMNNGAGTPCWYYTVDVRRVDAGGASCLHAYWMVGELCSSSTYSAMSPVVVATGDDFLVGWYGGASGRPASVRVVGIQGGQVVWPRPEPPPLPDPADPPPRPNSAEAEQIVGDLAQEPGCGYGDYQTYGGSFISRGLSAGVDGSDHIQLAWCNEQAFLATVSIGNLRGAVVRNVSAGGAAVTPPQIAADPRIDASKSAVVWLRLVTPATTATPATSLVQARRLEPAPDSPAPAPFRDVHLASGWDAELQLSGADNNARLSAPSLSMAANGRATTAWRSQLPGDGRHWSLKIATTDRRGTPTPEATVDPSTFFVGVDRLRPAAAALGADRAVVAFHDDGARLRLVIVGADGSVGAPETVADRVNGEPLVASAAGAPTMLAWGDQSGHLQLADIDDGGQLIARRDVTLPSWQPSEPWSAVPLGNGATRMIWATSSEGEPVLRSVIVQRDGTLQNQPSTLYEGTSGIGVIELDTSRGADGTIGVIWRVRQGFVFYSYQDHAARISPDGSIGREQMLSGVASGTAGDARVAVEDDGTVTLAWPAQSYYQGPVRTRIATIRSDDRLELARTVPAEGDSEATTAYTPAAIGLIAGHGTATLLRASNGMGDQPFRVTATPIASTIDERLYDGEILAGEPTAGTAAVFNKPRDHDALADPFAPGDVAGAVDATFGQVAAWREGYAIRTSRRIGAETTATVGVPTYNGLPCPKVWILDAIGSGEQAGKSPTIDAFVRALTSKLLAGGLSADEIHHSDVPYPAVSITQAFWSSFTRLDRVLKFQWPSDYSASVLAGIEALNQELQAITASCGQVTRFVLAGYSQGAELVGTAIKQAPAKVQVRVLATMLFADPKFNPADAEVARGSFEGNRGGMWGRRPEGLAETTGHRVRSYCRRFDPVCQGALQGCVVVQAGTDFIPVHTTYDEPEEFPPGPDRLLVTAPQLAAAVASDAAASATTLTAAVWTALSRLGASQLACAGSQIFSDSNSRVGQRPATTDAAEDAGGYVLQYLGAHPAPAPPAPAAAGRAARLSATASSDDLVARLKGSESPGGRRIRPGTTLDLDAADSSAPDPGIVRYDWDLDGDGVYDRSSADPRTSHRFDSQPVGPVSLRVLDHDGRTATDALTVTLDPAAPTVPGTPQHLQVRQAPGGYLVLWDPPASDGGSPITHYAVASEGGDLTVVAPSRQLTFPDDDPGRARGFTVIAVNAVGGSEPTAPSAPLAAGAPGHPDAAAVVLADSPAAYWRMGESAGTTMRDATTHHNDGSYLGGVTLGQAGAFAGDPDTAASFDGNNDTARVPASTSLDVGRAFTLEGWIKRSATSKSQELMNKGANGLQLVVMNAGSGNKVFLRKAGVTTIAQSSAPVLADGRYHHVVATIDGPGSSAKVYLDGADVTQIVAAGGVQVIQDTRFPLTFGISASAPAAFDEFALYDQVLAASDVGKHYHAGIGG